MFAVAAAGISPWGWELSARCREAACSGNPGVRPLRNAGPCGKLLFGQRAAKRGAHGASCPRQRGALLPTSPLYCTPIRLQGQGYKKDWKSTGLGRGHRKKSLEALLKIVEEKFRSLEED